MTTFRHFWDNLGYFYPNIWSHWSPINLFSRGRRCSRYQAFLDNPPIEESLGERPTEAWPKCLLQLSTMSSGSRHSHPLRRSKIIKKWATFVVNWSARLPLLWRSEFETSWSLQMYKKMPGITPFKIIEKVEEPYR